MFLAITSHEVGHDFEPQDHTHRLHAGHPQATSPLLGVETQNERCTPALLCVYFNGAEERED